MSYLKRLNLQGTNVHEQIFIFPIGYSNIGATYSLWVNHHMVFGA